MTDPGHRGAAPVFVVGAPRSGTTLLAAMLAAHPAFDCGPETFCLWRWSRLDRAARATVLDPRDWPDAATRFCCSLALAGRPVHELSGLGRDDVRAWLAARPPSLATVLEALTAQRAQRRGKARWVEKTPRHLVTGPLIRATWPDARLVRVVRDPRDAALSLTRVPFGTPSLVTNLATLARLDEASQTFFATDEGSLTVRYEDLVAEPERELRRLCAFLGVDYDPAMIEGRAEALGLAAEHEWWKTDVTRPLDASRAGAWRREMPPRVRRYAGLNAAGFLREHGYAGARVPRRRVAVVPSGDALNARYDEMLLRLSDADVAIARPIPRRARDLLAADALVFFGVGGQLDPRPGGPALGRATELAALGALLAWRRLSGRPVAWVARLSLLRRRRDDPGERVVLRLLQVAARRMEADALPDLPGLPRPARGGRAPAPDGADPADVADPAAEAADDGPSAAPAQAAVGLATNEQR